SEVARPAFLAAVATPFFRRIVSAFSISPPASVKAFLHSKSPAPVFWRSSLTCLALIALLISQSVSLDLTGPIFRKILPSSFPPLPPLLSRFPPLLRLLVPELPPRPSALPSLPAVPERALVAPPPVQVRRSRPVPVPRRPGRRLSRSLPRALRRRFGLHRLPARPARPRPD